MSIQVMMQMLGQGFLVSLQLFVLTLLGSIPLGIPVAFMRMSKIAPLRWIARIYISVMRGTPLMLQMFAIYFAPYYVFGISLTPDSKWTACVVASIINYAGTLPRSIARAFSPFRAVNTRQPRCWAIRACRRFCIS